MARSVLVLLLTALLPGVVVRAEPPSPPPPSQPGTPNPPKGERPREHDDHDDEGALQRFKAKLEKMGPKEREQFKANWERWRAMGEKERKDLQSRASEERDRVKKCVDDAISKTGLTLSTDQREVFALRYRQERRKIEEQLCKEIDAEREQRMTDMLARLKQEFVTIAAATATPASATPTPAPTP